MRWVAVSRAARCGLSLHRLCFNRTNGHGAERYGAGAGGTGLAEGARVQDGGAGAGFYRTSGAGADCA